MPDITYRFLAEDELTPALARFNAQISKLQEAGKLPSPTYEAFGGKTYKEYAEGLRKARDETEEFTESQEGLSSIIERSAGTFARSFLIWHVGGEAIRAAGQAIQQIGIDFQAYYQWANLVGEANLKVAQGFTNVGAAAAAAGVSSAAITKGAGPFTMMGFKPDEAIEASGMVQDTLKQTGVNLQDAYLKARVFGVGIKEALEVGAVAAGQGQPQLQEQALAALKFENLKKYQAFEIQTRQQTETYALEDSQRATKQATEDRFKAINREREERHRLADEALEDQEHQAKRVEELQDRQLTRQMADRHRTADRATQDRDRQQEWADQDEDIAFAREKQDRGMFKRSFQDQVDIYKQRELEDKHLQHRRDRELADEKQRRKEEDETQKLQRGQADARDTQNEAYYNKNRKQRRGQRDENISDQQYEQDYQQAQARDFEQQQKDMARGHAKERQGLEGQSLQNQLELNKGVDQFYNKSLQAYQQTAEPLGQALQIQQMGGTIGPPAGRPAGPVSTEDKGVQAKLDQLLKIFQAK